jgi:hypothetical protein
MYCLNVKSGDVTTTPALAFQSQNCNLTMSQNNHNHGVTFKPIKFRGVTYVNTKGYRATINNNKHQEIIGHFSTAEAAAMAYDARARELHGTKARLNFYEPSERSRNGISQFKGVSWSKKCQKFEARIKHNGVMKYLGVYKSEVEAAKAFDAAVKELRGPVVKASSLNFPSGEVGMGEPRAARSMQAGGDAIWQRNQKQQQQQQQQQQYGPSNQRPLSTPTPTIPEFGRAKPQTLPRLSFIAEGEEDLPPFPGTLKLSALPSAPTASEPEKSCWPLFPGSSAEATLSSTGAFPVLHPFDQRSFSRSMSATSLRDNRLEATHLRSIADSSEDCGLNLLAQISWTSL